MKKILFLPLLQMQSGHHKAAEAMMNLLKEQKGEFELKKVDLLSYTNKILEKMITDVYLKWIRYAPETYNLAYKSMYASSWKKHPFLWYQLPFQKKLEQLLKKEKPDLIICTHGFPSYLLSKLKRKNKCNIPIINVYTDFFINNVWGKEEVDYHFIPTQDMKEKLRQQYFIPEDRMIVTGIPVHNEITKRDTECLYTKRPSIILSGGNSGLGGMKKLADRLKKAKACDFIVLCGNNKKLYHTLLSWNLSHIKPMPYISSRAEMNRLYEQADAIITKPGGITISEALRKRLPIFVHDVLPGQELINLCYLKEKGLVFPLYEKESFEKQLIHVLKNNQKLQDFSEAVNAYQKGIELDQQEKMVNLIQNILKQPVTNNRRKLVEGTPRKMSKLIKMS